MVFGSTIQKSINLVDIRRLNSVAFSHTAINRPQIGQERKREIEMDQFRERKRAEAHVSPGQVNAHGRAQQ